jgi:hypothetical protein
MAAVAGEEEATMAAVRAAAFAYLWRPGVGYVATLSSAAQTDRAVILGGDEGEGEAPWRWREMNAYLGENIEVMPGDRIVCELWTCHHGQNTIEDLQGVRFNGAAVYNDGDLAPNPAVYLELEKGVKV